MSEHEASTQSTESRDTPPSMNNDAPFSMERIAALFGEVAEGTRTVKEVCRRHGISQASYYRLKRKYANSEAFWATAATALPGDMQDVLHQEEQRQRPPPPYQRVLQRLREAEAENLLLQRLLVEQLFEVDALRAQLQQNKGENHR